MSYLILFGILLFANIWKTSSAVTLDCTFADVTHTLIGSRYACIARALFDGSDIIRAVYGSHQSGRGDENVHSLRIESQNLPFFPRDIESFFPNITALHFFINSITDVNKEHLIPFPNLEYLHLGTNSISTLDSNLFFGLTSMRYANFYSNDIKHIGHNINLPSTGTIDFRLNSCINTAATTDEQIIMLKLDLLRNCPPTISQIEDTLESRPNLLTNVNFEVQGLVNRTDNMGVEVRNLTKVVTALRYKNAQLETRVALLEALIENKLNIKVEEAIDNKSLHLD